MHISTSFLPTYSYVLHSAAARTAASAAAGVAATEMCHSQKLEHLAQGVDEQAVEFVGKKVCFLPEA
uniref:Uncharacterized protein n=1 Tax=Ascaris lumbricoides TaxID=6252 RepID=A0A0M3IFE3_ASCLU